MDPFDDTTLWRISAFQRAREAAEANPFGADDRPTLLPTTLLADLRRKLRFDPVNGDVLEVVVWRAFATARRRCSVSNTAPSSGRWQLFPRQFVYHSPRDVAQLGAGDGLGKLALISAEPPHVRPPGDNLSQRVAHPERYRPMEELLWAVALHGPRGAVLNEISGRVAYKLVSSGVRDLPSSLGALRPAVERLRQEAVPLRDLAGWPGMRPVAGEPTAQKSRGSTSPAHIDLAQPSGGQPGAAALAQPVSARPLGRSVPHRLLGPPSRFGALGRPIGP